MVAPAFEVKQKVLQLVVQRIMVEDHHITIEHGRAERADSITTGISCGWRANFVVFHHVVNMTRVLQELIDEGSPVTPAIMARLSPYKREHINCFGHYDLQFDQVPQPIIEELRFSPRRTVREG